jgi:prepilin-type processing-associated H-X9-DG protein
VDVKLRPENNPPILKCPSEPGLMGFTGTYTRDSDSYNYAKNIFCGIVDNSGYPLWKREKCKKPSVMFNAMDYKRINSNGVFTGYHYFSKSHTHLSRHNGNINVLYVDGHANAITLNGMSKDTADQFHDAMP